MFTLTRPSNTGDAIRGFAMVSVLVDHYVYGYLTDYFYMCANGIVALFFAISGYFVARKLMAQHPVRWKSFFITRAAAIYPLFLACVIFESIAGLRGFSVTAYLGLDSPDIYWFVSAIIHCYLLTPLLVRGLRAMGPWRFIGALTGAVLLLNLILLGINLLHLDFLYYEPFYRRPFVYRNMFMGHVLVYGLAMSLQGVRLPARRALGWSFLGLFLSLVWFTRYGFAPFPDLGLGMVFAFAAALATAGLVGGHARIPRTGFLVWVGQHSYPVFLLHMFFYDGLVALGLIRPHSLLSVLVVVLLYPLFFLACEGVDRVLAVFSRFVASRWLDQTV